MVYRQYSDAEKAAYYARKSKMVGRPAYSSYPRRKPQAKPYRKKASYQKKNKYDYPGVGRRIGSGLGSMVGNVVAPGIGGYVGSALGGVVGQGAQALVKNITGFGDYQISKNSLVYNVDAVPEFSTNNERCTMVCHREYITDIVSSTSFNVQSFRINPAISTTFPWLSALAQNYEQYVVQGMVFEFKTTSATAIGSTNTALGTIVLATQYNSLAPPFSNKQQMENYEFSQSSVPSQSVLHPIECDPIQTQCGGIFNLYDANDVDGDTRLYDIGRFSIGTVGMQVANVNLGELWVSYKICFLKPRLQSVENTADIFQIDISGISGGTPIGAVLDLTPSPYNSGMISFDSAFNSRFTIDPTFVGVMQVSIQYRTSDIVTAFNPPYLNYISGNCSVVTSQYTDSVNAAISSVVTGVHDYTTTMIGYVECKGGLTNNGLGQVINLVGATVTGVTFTSANISFISVPSNIITDPFP